MITDYRFQNGKPCRYIMQSAPAIGVLISVLLAGGGCVCMRGQDGQAAPDIPVYGVKFAPAPVVIDGSLDDPAWQRAAIITNFMIPETWDVPVSRTEARILWDKEYLYAGFRAYDRDVWGFFENHDESTCSEDVLEVFLQPHPDGARLCYYNFEVNALGTCLDGWIPNGKRALTRRGIRWNCPGLKIATMVKGSLNEWSDEDEYWQLEIAIPFAGLPTLAGLPPTPGDIWHFHLARYDYSVYLPDTGRELSSSAPFTKGNFHLHEEWPRLIFEE